MKSNTMDMLTLAEASRILPGHPHVSTLLRWGKGIRGVRLNLVKVGGRWAVSREAIEEFIAATTAAADRSRPAVAVPCSQQAQRKKADTAGQMLDVLVFSQQRNGNGHGGRPAEHANGKGRHNDAAKRDRHEST